MGVLTLKGFPGEPWSWLLVPRSHRLFTVYDQTVPRASYRLACVPSVVVTNFECSIRSVPLGRDQAPGQVVQEAEKKTVDGQVQIQNCNTIIFFHRHIVRIHIKNSKIHLSLSSRGTQVAQPRLLGL